MVVIEDFLPSFAEHLPCTKPRMQSTSAQVLDRPTSTSGLSPTVAEKRTFRAL
jgi:hypothetical protein